MTRLLSLPSEAGDGGIVVFEVGRAEASRDLALAFPEPEEVAAQIRVNLEEDPG